MTTAQINVRLDAHRKEAGDAALREAGISPSEIVRALWDKVAQRGQALQDVMDVLYANEDDEVALGRERKLALVDTMANGFETFANANGANRRVAELTQENDVGWHDAVWQERTEKWKEGGN